MKIDTWKEILTPGGLRPIIFFQPSVEFITFCKNNNYSNIPIRILGTGGVYDGIYYVSIDIRTDKIYCGSPSVVMPLQYSAVLNRDFTIFPSRKGSLSVAFQNQSVIDPVTVEGQAEPSEKKKEDFVSSEVDIQDSDNITTPTPTSMQNCTANSLRLWQIILMIIIIILVLIACFFCYF